MREVSGFLYNLRKSYGISEVEKFSELGGWSQEVHVEITGEDEIADVRIT